MSLVKIAIRGLGFWWQTLLDNTLKTKFIGEILNVNK